MKVISHYLGPAVRHYTPALLFDGQLEVDVPTWSVPEAPQAFVAVVDCATRKGSPLARALQSAEKHLWLQTRQGQAFLPEVEGLGDKLVLTRSLYPGTTSTFRMVRNVYLSQRQAVAALTNTVPGATAAAFEFHWRVYEYWLELDRDPERVLIQLENEAICLTDPIELVLESYANRFFCTFGAAQATAPGPSGGKVIHPVVDSPLSITLGLECMRAREDLLDPDGLRSDTPARLGHDEFLKPLAFHVFSRVTNGRVPAITARSTEKIVSIMTDKADALDALRHRCRAVAADVTDGTTSEAEIRRRLKPALRNLEREAQEVRAQDARTTREYLSSLAEDRVLWVAATSLAGIATGAIPADGTLPAIATLFASLGTQAIKARRLGRENVAKDDLRLLYYLARSDSRS